MQQEGQKFLMESKGKLNELQAAWPRKFMMLSRRLAEMISTISSSKRPAWSTF